MKRLDALAKVDYKDSVGYDLRIGGSGKVNVHDHGDKEVLDWMEPKEALILIRKHYNDKRKESTVKLNSSHSAKVTATGVKVGCQEFTHEAIRNLAKAVDKYL